MTAGPDSRRNDTSGAGRPGIAARGDVARGDAAPEAAPARANAWRDDPPDEAVWDEAVRWLFALERRGIKLDLERMRACLEDLGRPQESFASILVAGTNGKGSTAAGLASVFSRTGRTVGLYTSPHLLDYRERIRLDGALAPKGTLLRLITRDREIWERHELSFFEATTALAFAFFREAGADLAVLEVGLGGRLDATNTAEPILSVITSLGMDHAHLLGATAAAIAGEKAGILRPGVPAIVAGGAAGSFGAVERRARELGAPLFRRTACLRVDQIEETDGTSFRVRRREGAPAGFVLPEDGLELRSRLPGIHQAVNGSLAVLGPALLRERGWGVTDAEIQEGIGRLRWPGRCEAIPGFPLIADVAHNHEGAQVLARAVAGVARGRGILPVAGMMAQKDHGGFFRELSRVAREVRIAPLAVERAAPAADLEAAARAAGLTVRSFPRIAPALEDALEASARDGSLVLLCGSFHALEEGYRFLGLGPVEALW